MFENTKGVIRNLKSRRDRQYNGQKFEDIKEVIRNLKSRKDRMVKSLNIPKGVIRSRKSKDIQYNGKQIPTW